MGARGVARPAAVPRTAPHGRQEGSTLQDAGTRWTHVLGAPVCLRPSQHPLKRRVKGPRPSDVSRSWRQLPLPCRAGGPRRSRPSSSSLGPGRRLSGMPGGASGRGAGERRRRALEPSGPLSSYMPLDEDAELALSPMGALPLSPASCGHPARGPQCTEEAGSRLHGPPLGGLGCLAVRSPLG